MIMFSLIVLAWWLSGVIITVYELRYTQDVDLGSFLMALIVGILGPLLFTVTFIRKWPIILFKKVNVIETPSNRIVLTPNGEKVGEYRGGMWFPTHVPVKINQSDAAGDNALSNANKKTGFFNT